MKKFLFIIFNFLFLLTSVNAETFSQALKKAYKNNPELNAERESLNVSEQELEISKGSYLPNITLSGSKSREETEKLTNICQINTEITLLIIKFLKVKLFDKTAKKLDIKIQKYTTGIEE